MTDLLGVQSFFGKPHYRGMHNEHFANVLGMREFDPEKDDSFVDIEPLSGTLFYRS